MVTFVSSNASIATIDGDVVHGVSAGASNVSVTCAGDCGNVSPAAVGVSEVVVRLASLETYVLSGAAFAAPLAIGDNEFEYFLDTNASVVAVQELAAEADVANVFAYVHFSDETSAYVTQGVNTTVVDSTSLVVANATAPATLQVPVGAVQQTGSDFVRVTLNLSLIHI